MLSFVYLFALVLFMWAGLIGVMVFLTDAMLIGWHGVINTFLVEVVFMCYGVSVIQICYTVC